MTTLTIGTLPQLLKSLPKIIGSFQEVIFTTDGHLVAANATGCAKIKLPVKLDVGAHALSVAGAAFSSAILNKPNLVLSVENNLLVLKSPNYRVELNPKPIASYSSPKPLDGEPLGLPEDIWSLLSEMIPKLSIEKLHPSQPDPNFTVVIDSKRIFLGVQDKHQLVFCLRKNPEPKFQCKFQVPYPTAVILFKGRLTSGSALVLSDSCSYTKSTLVGFPVETSLSWPVDDNANSVDEVFTKSMELRAFEGSSAQLSKAPLTEFVANARSISLDDTRVSLSFKSNSLLLSCNSSSGSIKSRIELASAVDDHFSFQLELKFLGNFLSKVSDEFELSYDSGILKVKSDGITVVSATSV
jgi:hypothetical protein